LPHLDAYAVARNRAASFYDRAFANHPHMEIPKRFVQSTHVFHQYTLKLKDASREGLLKHLTSKGVPMMIYYPVPLHQQKAYLNPRYQDGDFPVSEMLSSCVFSLPMHTELDQDQLEYITQSVLEFFKTA